MTPLLFLFVSGDQIQALVHANQALYRWTSSLTPLPCSSGWPRTHYGAQPICKFTVLPQPPSSGIECVLASMSGEVPFYSYVSQLCVRSVGALVWRWPTEVPVRDLSQSRHSNSHVLTFLLSSEVLKTVAYTSEQESRQSLGWRGPTHCFAMCSFCIGPLGLKRLGVGICALYCTV